MSTRYKISKGQYFCTPLRNINFKKSEKQWTVSMTKRDSFATYFYLTNCSPSQSRETVLFNSYCCYIKRETLLYVWVKRFWGEHVLRESFVKKQRYRKQPGAVTRRPETRQFSILMGGGGGGRRKRRWLSKKGTEEIILNHKIIQILTGKQHTTVYRMYITLLNHLYS
jgi:hypothetical protein